MTINNFLVLISTRLIVICLAMDKVTVVRAQNGSPERQFLPVSDKTQTFLCALLGIPIATRHEKRPAKNLLAPETFERMAADGNCFFRSISFVLTGTEAYHGFLRRKTVEAMKTTFRHNVAKYVSAWNYQSVDNYLAQSRMMQNATWATDVEMKTAASLLGLDIFSYSMYGNCWAWLKFSPFDDSHRYNTAECIYLNHTDLNHFDVVISVIANDCNTTTSMETTLTYMKSCKKQERKDSLVLDGDMGNRYECCTGDNNKVPGVHVQNKKETNKGGRTQCYGQNADVIKQSQPLHCEENTDMNEIAVTSNTMVASERQFLPLSGETQALLCESLGIQLVTKHEKQLPKTLFSPKTVKKITPDGNCFFRSISFVLTGRQVYYGLLRRKVVDGMKCTFRQNVAEYIRADYNSVDEYVTRSGMMLNSTWATDIEIKTTASLLGTDILLYTLNGKSWEWLRYTPFDDSHRCNTAECIYVNHTNSNHFDVVTSVVTKNCNTSTDTKATPTCVKSCKKRERQHPIFSEEEHCKKKVPKVDLQNKKEFHRQACKAYYAQNADSIKKSRKLHYKENANTIKEVRQCHYEENGDNIKRARHCHYAENSDVLKEYYEQNKQVIAEKYQENKQVIAGKYQEKKQVIAGKYQEKKQVIKLANELKKDARVIYCKMNKDKIKATKKQYKLSEKRRPKNSITKEIEMINKFSTIQTRRKKILEELDNNNTTVSRVMGTFDISITFFHSIVRQGPDYICTCCKQIWFRSTVVVCNIKKYTQCDNNVLKHCVTGTKSCNGTEWICLTCHKSLCNGTIPTCSKLNLMHFPEKPECLELTPLEERLISPRIPFMQIRELPRGAQLSIHGSVVNVPSDVKSTIDKLPRQLSESHTIAVQLKRKLSYKHYYSFEMIRPNRVFRAAQYLTKNSELFRSQGIEIDSCWEKTLVDVSEDTGTDWSAFLNSHGSNQKVPVEHLESDKETTEHNVAEPDLWTEEEPQPVGVTDTLLDAPFMDDSEADLIMNVAPGEGNQPLGLFLDTDAESLSFPTIYCGERQEDNRKRPVPLCYSTICKWELRNVDRRVASCIPNIFFKLKKLQIKRILGTASISLRKCKSIGKNVTAGQMKNKDFVDNILKLDEGFRVLKNLRGSPPYFEKCKKDLFAMIRQLGTPTWFCSFSAAETRWPHVLQTLGRIVDKKNYSEEEISEMSWQKKSELIQHDPVTCVRIFDHMVQVLMHKFIKSDVKPLGEVVDYFYRIEFQQRGSPHVHALFWISNAPKYGKSTDQEIANFVDKHSTCAGKFKTANNNELINLQKHSHAKTCKKKGRNICRFNFPLPPMRETVILTPFGESDLNEEQRKKLHEHKTCVQLLLEEMKYGDEVTFQQFLEMLGLSHEEYISAVRYSLKRPKLFVKRLPSEIRINSYNENLLLAWQANMDMQYVLDPYACAIYILSYISKGQRGMSKLLEAATKEAKLNNQSISNQVRHIGNKFLNSVEISAQEAVYLILQIPLRRSSRKVQFINTSHPDQRCYLLKQMEIINDLPDDSTDIVSDNVMKQYQRRPKKLEAICLADFVALYEIKPKNPAGRKLKKKNNCDVPESDLNDDCIDDIHVVSEEVGDNPQELSLQGGLKLVARLKPKVLRSVRYDRNKDPENYFREQMMLYTPWRDEDIDLKFDCNTYEESYGRKKDLIFHNSQLYEKHSDVLDSAEQDLSSFDIEEDAIVACNAQHLNEQDRMQGAKDSRLFDCFVPGENKHHQEYDLINDSGAFPTSICNISSSTTLMEESRFKNMVQALNKEQFQFFYYVLNSIKLHQTPLRLFLSGGAGVGKSRLLNAIFEAVTRYLNSEPGENPDDLKTLKVSPTGKAAFNIKGNTLHSAFHIPANSSFRYIPLDSDKLNTVRQKYAKLRVIFIDEISMVGSGMFNFIDQRLQQIKGTKLPFGNVSIIAVGDLFQLQPVFDSWIFEQPKSLYSTLAVNLWQEYFTLYELQVIMRQKEDHEFAALLNRLREGNQTLQDISVLQTRLITQCKQNSNHYNFTHLYTTNAAVDHFNNFHYNNTDAEKVTAEATDIVLGDLTEQVKNKLLLRVPADPSKTMGLRKLLPLAVGGLYDLTCNIDVNDGMTNGAECAIQEIEYRIASSSRPSIIWVKFRENCIGNNHRLKHRSLSANRIEKNWTPIFVVNKQFVLSKSSQVRYARYQFPLRQAAAKTIHRCQGDTLDNLVVDFNRAREHHHYVGLSRVRNIDGLCISTLNSDKISVSEKVKFEMARMRKESKVNLTLPLVEDLKGSMKIIFHNVRSLVSHKNDILNDFNVNAADISILVETRLTNAHKTSDFVMGNFQLYRNDNHLSSCANYGTATYVKSGLICLKTPFAFNYNNIEITVTVLTKPIYEFCIVSIYRSPSKATVASLLQALKAIKKDIVLRKPALILGDFNIDLTKDSAEASHLIQEMDEYTQLIRSVTTDYDSHLDHAYTNVPSIVQCSGVLESYFSDHKPIYVSLNNH